MIPKSNVVVCGIGEFCEKKGFCANMCSIAFYN